MLGGGRGGSQQVMILSKIVSDGKSRGRLCRTFLDTNTKRDQGKKAQFSNIFAAKVIVLSDVRRFEFFFFCRRLLTPFEHVLVHERCSKWIARLSSSAVSL